MLASSMVFSEAAENGRVASSAAITRPRDGGEPAPKSARRATSPTMPKGVLHSDWPLKELAKFKEDATELSSPAWYAAAVAERQKALLDGIPVALRNAHGLPTETTDLAVVKANAEQNYQTIVKLVESAQHAWIQQAETFNSPKEIFTIDESMEEDGRILRLLASAPSGKWDYLKGIVDAADSHKGDGPENTEQLLRDEQSVVTRTLLSAGEAARLFEACVEFAHKHGAGDEPKACAIKSLLEELHDQDVRAALRISPASKYVKIKSKAWRQDLTSMMTLAFVCSAAWVEGTERVATCAAADVATPTAADASIDASGVGSACLDVVANADAMDDASTSTNANIDACSEAAARAAEPCVLAPVESDRA